MALTESHSELAWPGLLDDAPSEEVLSTEHMDKARQSPKLDGLPAQALAHSYTFLMSFCPPHHTPFLFLETCHGHNKTYNILGKV